MDELINKAFEMEEARLYAFDHCPLFILVMDRSQIILEVNKRFEIETGFTRSDMIGRHYSKFVNPEDLERDRDILDRFEETGEFLPDQNKYVNRYLKKSGGDISIEWLHDPAYSAQFRDYYIAFGRLKKN